MHAKTLAYQFGLTSYVLERNLSELSEQESLINPEQGGNCLNWVLGHITRSRNQALGVLGTKPLYPAEDFRAYSGEEPFDLESALPLEELKRRCKALQEPLVKAISAMQSDAMDKPAPFSPTGNPDETMGSLLAAFAFHEAYHVGQTGILRRVAGREGVVKSPAVATA
jgi:uncharacterized damage-inducible protein DinB